MSLADFLTDVCDVLAPARGQDEAGGMLSAPSAAAQTNVPCLLRERGGAVGRREGKAVWERGLTVYLDPADLDLTVTARHQLLVHGAPSRRLVVVDVVDFNTLGRLLALDCTEQPLP